MWLDIGGDSWEFEGVDGRVHTFLGPSVVGAIEFESRLRELGAYAEKRPNSFGSDLYRQDARFEWLVNRCLSLNGIEPFWCSWPQVERLLFGWVADDGQPQAALLVQIHGSVQQKAPQPPPPTIEQLIASLAASQGGIEAAVKLLKNLTPKQLAAITAAQAKACLVEDSAKVDAKVDRAGMEQLRQQMMERAKQHGNNQSQAVPGDSSQGGS